MVRRLMLAVASAALATLAGCAQPVQRDSLTQLEGPEYRAGDGPYGSACDGDWPELPEIAPPMEPLAADAALMRATRCIFESERVPDDGEWIVRLDQEATTGLDELADALRTPSETGGENLVCPAIAYLPIVITVTDATGRQFHPAIPTTACGAPLTVATDAIAALPWTTTARTRVARSRTELEITSGCPNGYKAMVALIAAEGDAGAQRFAVDTTPRRLRVCRFAVPPEAAGPAARGELYTGDLVAASTLDEAAAQELLAAIDSAPDPTTPCTELSSFAVIDEADGDRLELMVEVDGCYRAMVGTDVRQLDPDLVTRLLN